MRTKVDIYADCFPKQLDCKNDKRRQKAYNATRRAGKSAICRKEIIDPCLNERGVSTLYMGLTLDSVKAIIWDDLMEDLETYAIPYKGYEREGYVKFTQTDSRLSLIGIDTSYREMKKILGRKTRRVVIDEAGSMTIDMEKLCYQMIGPSLMDLQGELILAGTCEDIPNTFFEKITTGKENGWSVHRWLTSDNPHMRVQYEQEIQTILANNPLAINTSWFKTHYLNIWTTDDDKKIYKLAEHNFILASPFKKPVYTLAVDLGLNDDSAFVVQSYDEAFPYSIVNESFKSPDMDFTDVANKVKEIMSRYPISKLIVDGANLQGVEEMRRRHGLPFYAAQKEDKLTNMRLLRDDFIQAKVKILKQKNEYLIEEAENLIYNKDKTGEDSRCQNHLMDAMLYGWKDLRHFLYEAPIPAVNNLSNEYMDRYEKQLMEEMLNEDD